MVKDSAPQLGFRTGSAIRAEFIELNCPAEDEFWVGVFCTGAKEMTINVGIFILIVPDVPFYKSLLMRSFRFERESRDAQITMPFFRRNSKLVLVMSQIVVISCKRFSFYHCIHRETMLESERFYLVYN